MGGGLILHVRKLTVWVSDQILHKPGCTAIENALLVELLNDSEHFFFRVKILFQSDHLKFQYSRDNLRFLA